jgi:glycosyltransferase involved in cell wall biosynthesis
VLASAVVASTMWVGAWRAMRRNHAGTPELDGEPPGPRESQRSLLVVVPARDEEKNLGDCIASVLRSEYGPLRVRVVDDGSSDATPDIARAFAAMDPRVEVLAAGELPCGWLGKSRALYVGTRDADAEWILFLDADVRVSPLCLARAVAAAERRGADLLTMLPRLEALSFWELAAQTVAVHAILLSLDARAVNDPRSARAAAFGPFMLFRRSAYELIGGHRAVRHEVVEDLRLAEAVKRAHLRLVLARGTSLASLRMYDSLGAIVRGWSKNFHLAVDGKAWAAPIAAGALLFFYGGPWILPFVAPDVVTLAVALVALGAALVARADFARLYGVTARRPYLAPLGSIVLAWILVRAVTGGVEWKGRRVGRAR